MPNCWVKDAVSGKEAAVLSTSSRADSNSHIRKIFTQPVKRPPAHIYLRGSIYYFRYAFSKELREKFQHTEIRISLRTGFVHQARKIARYLSVCLEKLLMDDEKGKNYKILRDDLARELESFLAGYPEKNPPSIREIKSRIDGLRQKYMDEADKTLFQPPSGTLFGNDHKPTQVAPHEWLDHSRVIFMQPATNNPTRLMALHYPDAVLELLKLGIFKPEEITQETTPQIINEYHKMHISLNRIFSEREHGNYAYEREFAAPLPQSTIPQNIAPEPVPQKGLLLSDFIKQFMDTKIKDGRWTERSIPTHENRISTLIDILGNIPVASIDRTKMREFRDKLVKLPPNRTRSQQYKDKSIDELLKMNIKTTLNITTVNTTLETISGMFEWGIREGLIDKNPAAELTLKDDIAFP